MSRIPTRIEALLAADNANAPIASELMQAFHPLALRLFDRAFQVFALAYKELGDWKVENDVCDQLAALAKANGLSKDEFIKLLKERKAAHIPGAVALWARLWTIHVAKIITLACQRYAAWGGSELFRLRIGPAQGYLRLEAEAVGLLTLFMENDALAHEWSNIKSNKEGQAFFGRTRKPLRKKLEGFDLSTVSDIASGVAHHVRMTGVVRSISEPRPGDMKLPDQDVTIGDEFSFNLAIAHFHRIQARVLTALGQSLGLTNVEWKDAVDALNKEAAILWAELSMKYASHVIDLGADL